MVYGQSLRMSNRDLHMSNMVSNRLSNRVSNTKKFLIHHIYKSVTNNNKYNNINNLYILYVTYTVTLVLLYCYSKYAFVTQILGNFKVLLNIYI